MYRGWIVKVMILAACISMAGCKKAEEKLPNVQTEESGGTEVSAGQEEGSEEKEATEGTNGDTENSGNTGDMSASESEADLQKDYIFPKSDTELLSNEELGSATIDELRLARNEIFARHGRLFTSEDLQAYFAAKDWYQGSVKPEDFSDSMLSETEKENIRRIQSWENMGDILDTAGTYKKIMDENLLFSSNGLLDYGYIGVSMSSGYTEYFPVLEDKGSYYEAKGQHLRVPIYYEWNYIKNIKPGDVIRASFSPDNELDYRVTGILQEHGQEARVISVYDPEFGWDISLVFTDAFENGKYVLAIVDELWEDNYAIWNSDDICCACKTLYSGSFYLSKDCVIDVNGEKKSVEDQREVDWERNPFGGAIYGDITEVDDNGLITKIRQQVAG